MTDKERLEQIKQDVKMTRKDLAVSSSNEMTLHMDIMLNSMDYLIERVQELEDELMAYKSIARNNKRLGENMLSDSIKECRRIKKEITFVNDRRLHHKEKAERYREALEFYGNKENYLHEISRLKATNYSKVMDDYGETARKALEELE